MFAPYKKAIIQRAHHGEFCSLQSVIYPLLTPFRHFYLFVLTDMSIDVSTVAYNVLSIILILEIQRALSALLEKYGRQQQL